MTNTFLEMLRKKEARILNLVVRYMQRVEREEPYSQPSSSLGSRTLERLIEHIACPST